MHVAVATAALVVLIWILRRVKLWTLGLLEQFTFPPESLAPGLGTDFHPLIVQAGKVIIGVMWAATLFVVVYLWLVYSLGQFPESAHWAEQLGEFLIALFLDFAKGALSAVRASHSPGIR